MCASTGSGAVSHQLQERDANTVDEGSTRLQPGGSSLYIAIPPRFLKHNDLDQGDAISRSYDLENNRVIIEVNNGAE